jgi:putative aldouronate transport system substrate-binding protein
MKKITLVAMMAILVFALVGCKGGKSGKKEALNISVFTIQQREQPTADNPTYKWIEEKFGVTFNWDILVGDKDQKIGVLIASGDLPDMVEVDSEKFQGAGCLIDLKPLVEKYCPNIMKHYASAWKKMLDIDSEKDADGKITKEHIYSLPNWGVIDGKPSGTYYNQNGWWIQKAVLKEFGYPTIKTIDQYFDLIEAYYKKYPTIDGMPTIPFNIITYDWEAFDLWNPPNFLAGYPNDGNGHVVKDGNGYKYINNWNDENTYKWLKLANGYYKRGLIDPASFTDNRDQYYAKISQGRVLGMFIQGWQFMGDNAENALWSAGKDERTYAPLPVTFDESITPWYVDRDLPNLQRGYGITTKCGEAKAIKILQFFDQMLEIENQKVLYWGFEGQDYLIDADGSVTGKKGGAYRTQAMRDQQKDPNYNQNHFALLFREEAPKIEGTIGDNDFTRSMDDLPWEYAVTQRPVDVELWKAYNVGSYKELAMGGATPRMNPGWYPMWQCEPAAEKGGLEEQAAIAKKQAEGYQRKYLAACMAAKSDAEFEATWKEFKKLMDPIVETWDEFMNKQLKNRVEAFGGFQD